MCRLRESGFSGSISIHEVSHTTNKNIDITTIVKALIEAHYIRFALC